MEQDLQKMQQEAAHRVHEMQSRAKKHLQEEPPKQPPEPPKEITPEKAEPIPASAEAPNLLDGLLQDSERTLILLLILLLSTEQEDLSAVFSLLYLLL
jgi:hypothetical protein